MFNIPKCMTMFNFPKCMIFNCVRTLASRKHGPFRKVPHLPIKGPRDFDYWKRLKRKGLGKKEHLKENTYRTNELRKRRPRPAKKKCEEPPIKDQEEDTNPKKC